MLNLEIHEIHFPSVRPARQPRSRSIKIELAQPALSIAGDLARYCIRSLRQRTMVETYAQVVG